MFLNGTAMPGATPLNESALAPFPAYPPPQTADYQYFFTINQTEPTEWQINFQPFEDPVTPILFGNVSDGWISNTTYFVPSNASVVDIILSIAPDSLDTMGHPLHLHGHTFWTLGSGTGNYDASQLNLVNPPVKDTELIPADGWLWIRYIADNPGAWVLPLLTELLLTQDIPLPFGLAFSGRNGSCYRGRREFVPDDSRECVAGAKFPVRVVRRTDL
jgi:L-ascorbate oxidase